MLMMALQACTTVEPGEVGVLVTRGVIEANPLSPGMYGEMFCTVYKMSTKTQTYVMAGAAQADHPGSGTVQVLAKDQLAVTLDVSVQFHLNGTRAVDVYRTFGQNYDDSVIHPLVRTAVRDAASEFTALQLVDQRAQLQTRMETLVRERVNSTLSSRQLNADAIRVDSILLQNIDLPNSLDESIANVQRQRQETARSEQQNLTAQQEAARALTAANGESQAALARTRANAEARVIDATATANANRLISQSITPELVRLRQIEVMSALLQSNGTRTIVLPTERSVPLLLPAMPNIQ